MEHVFFKSKDSFFLWKKVLKYVKNNGNDFKDENNNVCREVLNVYLQFDNSDDIHKPLIYLKSIKDWQYPSNELLYNSVFSKSKKGFKYTIGNRIFNFSLKEDSIDQIESFIIPLLKKTPYSRRAVVTLWNPILDSDFKSRSVPGMIALDFKLRNNKLNVTAIIRSSDLFFGLPANVFQIFLLQDYVSKKLKVDKGFIGVFCNSAHIFEYQFEHIEKLLKND